MIFGEKNLKGCKAEEWMRIQKEFLALLQNEKMRLRQIRHCMGRRRKFSLLSLLSYALPPSHYLQQNPNPSLDSFGLSELYLEIFLASSSEYIERKCQICSVLPKSYAVGKPAAKRPYNDFQNKQVFAFSMHLFTFISLIIGIFPTWNHNLCTALINRSLASLSELGS